MKLKQSIVGAAIAAAIVTVSAPALARDTIQIAGSSTVLPFSSIVAEEFGNAMPNAKAPVVGSGGTGGGLRQFCQGVGENTIDIANASRAIRPAEVESCNKAGVKQIQEVMIGYDGIVFASRADKGEFKLTPQQVFAAIAAEVPVDGKMVKNPNTRWSQIDKSLPDQEIVLVIPGTNHGTREVFEEKVTNTGCVAYAEYKALDKEKQEAACKAFRQDGRVIEVAGDYTETLGRLDAQNDAVGVFGLSFYEQNRDRLKVATVDGVTPSLETIASGEYPVSRPLYFYVKGEHVGVVPGIAEFVEFYLSDVVSGDDSPLEKAGLIPLSDEARAEQVANFKAKKVVEAK